MVTRRGAIREGLGPGRTITEDLVGRSNRGEVVVRGSLAVWINKPVWVSRLGLKNQT